MSKANEIVKKVEVFLSSNPLITMLLYILGFLTSGYITWSALAATSQSPYVWLSYTIVMESGKAISYLEYVKTKQSKYFRMWLVLTFFSIAASMAFMVIENNVTENKSHTSSLAFQQATEKTSRIKDQINIKKSLLAQTSKDKEDTKRLIDDYNKSINNIQSQLNTKNAELKEASINKWTTTKDRIQKEIDQLKSKQNKDIQARDNLSINVDTSKLNTEIDSLNNQLNNIDYSSLPQEKATAGFYALFQFLGIGPKSIFWIEFIFTLALTTTFEILICMIYSLSKTGHFPDTKKLVEVPIKTKLEAKSNISLDKPKVSPVLAKRYKVKPEKKNKIGFHQDVDKQPIVCIKSKLDEVEFTTEDVDKYKQEMYKSKYKSGNARGFRTIGNNIGLSAKVAEKIHGHLCTTGIVEVVNGRTRILKEEA